MQSKRFTTGRQIPGCGDGSWPHGKAAPSDCVTSRGSLYSRLGRGIMFKRFMIGFTLGLGIMYWYLNNSENTWAGMLGWGDKAATGYRDDKAHVAADEVLEGR